MKGLKPWVSALCISVFQISNLHAEVVVIDSFTEGGFELDGSSADNPISSFSPIGSPVVRGRGVLVRGGGARILSLLPSDGFMHYDVSAAAFAPIGQQFTLTYYAAAGQIINLLGQNAFLFTFSSVTGQGDIEFGINSSLSHID
jgi:hypothetical protein